MKVDIRNHGVELPPAARAHVERAALMALGRVGSRVTLAAISIDARNRVPLLGAGAVQVAVRLDGPCKVLVVDCDRTIEAALVRALDRARRYVERDVARFGWNRSASAKRPASRRTRIARPIRSAHLAAATEEEETQ